MSPTPSFLPHLARCFGLAALLTGTAAATPYVNEIYFHPPQAGGTLNPTSPEDTTLEWLELYNPDPAPAVLTGWILSNGISYSFPDGATIPAGGYLVISASPAAFAAANPGRTAIGPWIGDLSNIDDTIELVDATRQTVDSVHYETEGDWASHRHVTTMDPNGYPYGWIWQSGADGGGKSLELSNPDRSHKTGQNWPVSVPDGGTPGAANSTFTTDAAPFIRKTQHRPAVPTPSQLVTVSAEITDENLAGLTVLLKWRISSLTPPAFSTLTMHDDGLNGDETAGDSLFTANLPGQANRAVVEYYIQATDATGHTRTWPGPSNDAGTEHPANALYQVDSEVYTGTAPLYRVIMTAAELDALDHESFSISNRTAQQYLCTFVTSIQGATEVRQQCTTRIRGNGSRGSHPRSVRVDFLISEPWQNNSGVNINGRFTYMQFIGARLAQAAGIHSSDAQPVAVRFNSQNRAAAGYIDPVTNAGSGYSAHLGLYASVEPINRDYLKHHFPNEPGGNLYSKRGNSDLLEWIPAPGAASGYPAHYISQGWEKQNNTSQLDYSDLHRFTTVMTDNAAAPGPNYLANVGAVLDLPQFLKALAVETFLTDGETKIFNGRDDDYSMYRTPAGKMKVLTHDFDTILGQGDSSAIPLASLPYTLFDIIIPGRGGDSFDKMAPLFAQPAVLQEYYRNLRALLVDGPFAKLPFDDLVIRELSRSGWAESEIAPIRSQIITFADARRADILGKISPALTAGAGLAVTSGYERTTTATAGPITGAFDAAQAATVLVNGIAATLDRRAATYSLASVNLFPGINRITIEEKDANGVHLRFASLDIWREVAPVAKSGTLAASTTWTAAGGPYQLTGDMPIGNGVTLTIQAGATVYMGPAASFTVSGTGRLVAEGTEFSHIRFTRKPGTTDAYGAISVLAASNETRLVWCDLEYGGGKTIGSHNATFFDNGSKVLIDHCTFTNSDAEYFSSDAGSFIVSNSYFQTYSKPAGYPPANGTGGFGQPEMLHGVNGLPAGGYGIYQGNLFGHTFGFNDVIDFTGGNRPGPVTQYIDNIFTSATDDCLDLDSTDAFISGNLFMHVHQDPARSDKADTGSAISGGTDNSDISEWTIYGNLFFDVDHAVLAKGVNGVANTKADRYTFLNNTIHQVTATSPYGSVGVDIAAFNFSDDAAGLPPASAGAGALIENNIISDCAALTANYDGSRLSVTFNNNILPSAWAGPGTGNLVTSLPGLHLERFADLAYDKVERASDYQLIRQQARAAFALCPGSPGIGTGPGGTDKGGLIFQGAQLTGVPTGTTALATATITVGPSGSFNPPGTTAYPAFPYGYTAYQWKLDAGAFSADLASTVPITLTGLTPGTHTLQVQGKNDAGDYQAAPTVAVWTVDPAYIPAVRIHEILATNTTAYLNGIAHPDVIELSNPGPAPVDISGWMISDDPLNPAKFFFPLGTIIPANGYLVLNADTPDGNPGLHLGFSLDGDGDNVILTNSSNAVVDQISFGLQLPNLSIGRTGPEGVWDLNQPSLGSANLRQATACPDHIVINEWLASSQVSFQEDQVELYNPDPLPAAIGGVSLTDSPDVPTAATLRPLSFMAAHGFAVLIADGNPPASQSNHLPFKLSSFYDWITLTSADGTVLDRVPVTSATGDVSEGRLPDGSAFVQTLDFPSFGLTNVNGLPPVVTTVTTNRVAFGDSWAYRDNLNALPANDSNGRNWTALNYNETGWFNGAGPLGRDSGLATIANPATGVPPFFGTDLANYTGARLTYYFRKTFSFTGTPSAATLRVSRWIDDGYLLYLNGQVLDRKNLAGAPPLAWNVLADTNIGDASAENDIVLTIPAGALVAGTNQLAAEVHQINATSSDVTFALKLDSTVTTTVPGSPDPARQRMIDLTDFLRITEVMYDPANGANYEFVELRNLSQGKTLDLTGIRFTEGIGFTFPALSLAPGAYVIVAKNLSAFRSVYGAVPLVAGVFTGKLDNSGENLTLSLPAPWTAAIQRFSYQPIWFNQANGLGSSLETLNAPSGAASRILWDEKPLWQASTADGGTPAGLNAVNDFPTWLSAYGLSAVALEDSDGDGFTNLAEYALGMVPVTPDGLIGTITAVINNNHLEGSLTLPAFCPPDMTYIAEISSNLSPTPDWTLLATRSGNGPWSGSATVSTGPATAGRVPLTIIDPASTLTEGRHFLRIRFTR